MSTNPRIGKYELQERLGQNGFAEVWKAFDPLERRYVAIKLLHANLKADPDFVARFQREAPVIVSLHHSNIVQCYDFSVTQFSETMTAAAYLVLDYIEGGTLVDYTRNTSQAGKLLPIPDVVRLFSSIGMAVDYAHQQHVIHGNLKPANILLDKRNSAHSPIGEPMVTDFAMARLMGSTGNNAGSWWNSSPLYISPEQVMGTQPDARSDIYSLGIMLYEVSTGTLPFMGSNAATIMMQQVNTVPASPALINPNIPSALSAIIMHCIEKDPAARFQSASAMVAALTDVSRQGSFNRSASDSSAPEMDLPTVISTKMSPLPVGVGADTSAVGAINRPLPGNTPVYSANMPMNSANTPLNPGNTPMNSANTPMYATGNQPYGTPVLPPVAPAPKKSGRRGLSIVLAALLILALVGSALGAYFIFFSKGTPTATAPQIVGHAYFASSGLVSPDSRQGITDQLQINLANIPAPQAGKSYYAWLLNDKTLEWKPISLGQLTSNSGTLSLFYAGDAVHSNLLATNNRFLVTEEDASGTPTGPSLDPKAWAYYAEFSQVKPVPTDPKSYSLYDHIKHLLADDPKVKAAGLTGGLDIWLYRNTQKILEWSGSARDAWRFQSVDFMRRQLARIMDYLDGTVYVQKDLPGQGLYADPTISKVGLLTFDPLTQDPPGYLYHIGKHLHDVTALPATSAAQKALAIQIKQAIDGVNLEMRTIHDDVLKLYAMDNAHLAGKDGLALLDEVATLANDAFAGKVDAQAQVTDGVVQIHYAIQRMATFDVRACTTSNPCSPS